MELVPAVVPASQDRCEGGRDLVAVGGQLRGSRLTLLELLDLDRSSLHLQESFQRLAPDEVVREFPEKGKLGPNTFQVQIRHKRRRPPPTAPCWILTV